MIKEYLVVEYSTKGVGNIVGKFRSKLKACEYALELYQQHKNIAGSDFEIEETE